MTLSLFAPGGHSDHNGFCFSKFFSGSASACTLPAFRCRELSWHFLSSRLVVLLALRILDRIFANFVPSCVSLTFCSSPFRKFAGHIYSALQGTLEPSSSTFSCYFSLYGHLYVLHYVVRSTLRRFETSLSPGKQILLLLLYLEFFTAISSPVSSGFSVGLLTAFASIKFRKFFFASLSYSARFRVVCIGM